MDKIFSFINTLIINYDLTYPRNCPLVVVSSLNSYELCYRFVAIFNYLVIGIPLPPESIHNNNYYYYRT